MLFVTCSAWSAPWSTLSSTSLPCASHSRASGSALGEAAPDGCAQDAPPDGCAEAARPAEDCEQSAAEAELAVH